MNPPTHNLSPEELEEALTTISQRTGYPVFTFHHLAHWTFAFFERQKSGTSTIAPTTPNGEALSAGVLESIILKHDEKLEDILSTCEIDRSDDIGRVIYELVDLNWIHEEPGDSHEAFYGHFDQSNLNDFLAKHGIKRHHRHIWKSLRIPAISLIIILITILLFSINPNTPKGILAALSALAFGLMGIWVDRRFRPPNSSHPQPTSLK